MRRRPDWARAFLWGAGGAAAAQVLPLFMGQPWVLLAVPAVGLAAVGMMIHSLARKV